MVFRPNIGGWHCFFHMKLFFLLKAGCFVSWIGIWLFCFEFLVFSQDISTMEKDPTKVFSVQHRGQILDVRRGESFMWSKTEYHGLTRG
jgi:hypothetical protein